MAYKRKYRKGAKIESLNDIENEIYIYLDNTIYHAGCWQSWRYRDLLIYMQRGRLFYAERIDDNEN